jgi:hypothetical protein
MIQPLIIDLIIKVSSYYQRTFLDEDIEEF